MKKIDVTEQLKEYIRDTGESAYKVSKEAGVGHAVLSRFLSGRRDIRGLEINNHPISGSGNIVRNHFSNPAIRLIWGANSFIAFFVSRTPVW